MLSEATYRPLAVAKRADRLAEQVGETIEGNVALGKPIFILRRPPTRTYALPSRYFYSKYPLRLLFAR